MTSRTATIIDVAERAGVSWKTVSRVMNGESNVRRETAARVTAAMQALDFHPNSAARALKGTRSYLLGVISNNLSAHYYTGLSRGGARACGARGYHLALEEIDLHDPDLLATFERRLRRARFDGVFLPPPVGDHKPLLDLLDARGVPYVRLAPATEVGRSDSVFADDASGVAALARHLWDLGHRRFGVVRGPGSHGASRTRLESFLAEIARLGGDPAAVRLAQGDFSPESGRLAGLDLLRDPDRPTAVFACNDEMAAGVVAAAGELALAIPRDVAVAGFDDSTVADLVWPRLTTVRQPIETLAELAVEMLVDPDDAGAVRTRVCPVELVVRASTLSA